MRNTLQKDSHLSGTEEAAKELYQRGEYAQALALWQKLLQKSPGRADWLVCCGNCLDALGNKKAAGDTVTIVVKRHNENMYSDVTLTVTLDSVSNAPDDEQQTPEEESYYSDDFGNYGDFGGWLH